MSKEQNATRPTRSHQIHRYWLVVGIFYLLILVLVPIALSALGLGAPAHGQTADDVLRVVRVTPRGEEVEARKQITIQFSRPVVPLGEMARDDSQLPVSISPPLPCAWRFADPRTLSCRLPSDAALQPATRYTVRIEPPFETFDGKALLRTVSESFFTSRPQVRSVHLAEWRSPNLPSFVVYTDQDVLLQSLTEHVFLQVGGARVPLVAVPWATGSEVPSVGRNFRLEPAAELEGDTPIFVREEPGLRSPHGPLLGQKEEVRLSGATFPEPRFLGVTCDRLEGQSVDLDVGAGSTSACDPQSTIWARFSSPVVKEELARGLVIEPDPTAGNDEIDIWENTWSYSRLDQLHQRGREYRLRLPPGLRAFTDYRLRAPRRKIHDEFGRPLAEAIDFRFATDHRRPDLVMPNTIAVLELEAQTHPPIYVTNLSGVDVTGRKVTAKAVEELEVDVPVDPVQDIAYAMPLDVRGWLGGQSGAVTADVLPRPFDHRRPLFAQVTPFQVHVKLGHQNTLVWITDLATGQPVEGAVVSAYRARGRYLDVPEKLAARGVSDASGLALLPGSAVVDPELDRTGYFDADESQLWFRVERRGSLALVPAIYDFEVDARGPNNSWIPSTRRRQFGHMTSWGATAQGVYRPGSLVQWKIWLRDQSNLTLVAPRDVKYDLRILDPKGDEAFSRRDIALDAFGSFAGDWSVPENAAMGWYDFEVSFTGSDRYRFSPLRVLITDFTPSPFRVTTELSGDRFEPGDEVTADVAARLHSGGPYGGAKARLNASLVPTPIRIDHPVAAGFRFDGGKVRRRDVLQEDLELDASGDASSSFEVSDSAVVNGRIEVEASVRDDRGKSIASRASAHYRGRSQVVGLRVPGWLLEKGQEAVAEAVAFDSNDSVLANASVTTTVQVEEVKAARVKGAGNAYLTRYESNWVPVERCGPDDPSHQPAETGIRRCRFTPDRPGLYEITTSVEAPDGRTHRSTTRRWGIGAGAALWRSPPGHELPIEVESTSIEVGETARFLIRNPFPGARALFTVERLGVQRSWTKVLAGPTEVVEVEVGPDQSPGFYFSAVVTSPRVDVPPAERGESFATVDLGKPAFRMGYVRMEVVDPYKQIEIEVTPEKETWRPREMAVANIVAKPRHEGVVSEPIQLAVAVLDEAVFDLIQGGRRAFDPYRGFYELPPLDVENYNLIKRLIGMQKFEKKGANAGGDGLGPDALRSDFRSMIYWNPALETDADGRARIEFELPDNLTGWRIVAMAATPSDRFGLGEGNLKVNQPIELRPALPNQVREGDLFEARFTVMNRTDETRELVLSASVEGPGESAGALSRTVRAEPYQRVPLVFPVRVHRPGTLNLTVRAHDRSNEENRDLLRVPLDVLPAQFFETAASWQTSAEDDIALNLRLPLNLRPETVELEVRALASVVGSVDGALAYLRDYPHDCWEQRLSRALGAARSIELADYLPADFAWDGAEQLAERVLADMTSFQAPNGGMAYWRPEDRYVSPYLSAYTALGLAWLAEAGYVIPQAAEKRLHSYLDRLLRNDRAFGDSWVPRMQLSTRAVAMAGLALRGRLDADELERWQRRADEMSLFGRAHYLIAADVMGHDDLVTVLRDSIFASSDRTAGKLQFDEALGGSWARMHYSSTRTSCSILSALVRSRDGSPTGIDAADDSFRLMRSITAARDDRFHWQNTQENVFCIAGMRDFATVYESADTDVVWTTRLDGRRVGKLELHDKRATPRSLVVGASDLGAHADLPGREFELQAQRRGSGRSYLATRLTWAPKELSADTAANAGIEVVREIHVQRDGRWQQLAGKVELGAGELVRVDLFIDAPTARNFVAVSDPVPGGIEPVNRDLETASQVDADKARDGFGVRSHWWAHRDWREFGSSDSGFYHRELGHDAVNFYSDFLGPGRYHLAWVGQVISGGEFQWLSAEAEEMYDPDVFGRSGSGRLVVPMHLEDAADEVVP